MNDLIIITNRELDVLELISYEFSTNQIAQQLYISPNTVKTHTRNIRSKLDVRNIAGMVRRGFELGILE